MLMGPSDLRGSQKPYRAVVTRWLLGNLYTIYLWSQGNKSFLYLVYPFAIWSLLLTNAHLPTFVPSWFLFLLRCSHLPLYTVQQLSTKYKWLQIQEDSLVSVLCFMNPISDVFFDKTSINCWSHAYTSIWP